MDLSQLMDTLPYGPAPEAAQPALDWLAQYQGRFGHFIAGRWAAASPEQRFEVSDPATGNLLALVAQGGAAEVDLAVRAARKAFKSWSQTPGHRRARYLYALARQVQKQARLLAVLESLDNGKPIRETRDIDIPLVARHFYHHAGWAQLMASEFPGHRPVGVVGQIIPWNFPLLMLAWKVAPALAMGNTVVLKPAEHTPLTALLFAEICQQVGLPPGVVNIVTGDGRTGAALVEHPGIDKIAFTGSTEVGRQIRQATAGSGKKLSLELGGKSPFIVFADADLDSAIEGAVDAIWFNQGQVCCAGSRLLVQESVADRFHQRLRDRMQTLRVGPPLDKSIDIGAIVAPVQLERIQALVQQGVAEGAQLWQPAIELPAQGCFFPPTLFTGVAPSATIAQEEIFGPVLVSLTFRTPQEAVRLANNTRYGLAASIWSEDINLALDLATQIRAGTVWINSTNLFDAASGFGGYRESGFGREGGREGLFEYLLPPAPPLLPTPARYQPTVPTTELPALDRTAKLFIGGKQVRPDSGYTHTVTDPRGLPVGQVGLGNRKDLRNAVEAARAAAASWGRSTGHLRAQILYYLAENLEVRAAEWAHRLAQQTHRRGEAEVEEAVAALFTAAAWADKYDGAVHQTPLRNVTLAVPEPLGVLGLLCPNDYPLLALAQLAGTALAMGNTLVVVPSPVAPLMATDLYQVLETSDVPAGTFNIVTGDRDELARTLAEHEDVDGIWYAGPVEGGTRVERFSASNMKRTWLLPLTGGLPGTAEILRQATQVKNIWVPYGA